MCNRGRQRSQRVAEEGTRCASPALHPPAHLLHPRLVLVVCLCIVKLWILGVHAQRCSTPLSDNGACARARRVGHPKRDGGGGIGGGGGGGQGTARRWHVQAHACLGGNPTAYRDAPGRSTQRLPAGGPHRRRESPPRCRHYSRAYPSPWLELLGCAGGAESNRIGRQEAPGASYSSGGPLRSALHSGTRRAPLAFGSAEPAENAVVTACLARHGAGCPASAHTHRLVGHWETAQLAAMEMELTLPGKLFRRDCRPAGPARPEAKSTIKLLQVRVACTGWVCPPCRPLAASHSPAWTGTLWFSPAGTIPCCLQWNIERGYQLAGIIEELRAIDADILSLQVGGRSRRRLVTGLTRSHHAAPAQSSPALPCCRRWMWAASAAAASTPVRPSPIPAAAAALPGPMLCLLLLPTHSRHTPPNSSLPPPTFSPTPHPPSVHRRGHCRGPPAELRLPFRI